MTTWSSKSLLSTNLIISGGARVQFIPDENCCAVVVRAEQRVSINVMFCLFWCSCRFAAFDSDKEVFVNGKPVRTKADSLAFLCHEVSVAVLNEITTQRMMQKKKSLIEGKLPPRSPDTLAYMRLSHISSSDHPPLHISLAPEQTVGERCFMLTLKSWPKQC